MFISKKQRILVSLFAGISLCLVIGAAFISSQGFGPLFAHAQSVTLTSSPPQSQISPDWLVRPSFAGQVLHWTQEVSSYTVNGPDPTNGKEMIGDIWVEVGSDGVPARIYTRYTLPDGTFVQELLQTPSTMTVLFDTSSRTTTVCNVANQSTSAKSLLSALPLFAKESLLSAASYVQVGNEIQYPLPATSSLEGVVPRQIYPAGDSIHTWLLDKKFNSGMSDTTAMEVNADGRVLATEIKLFSSTGELIQDNWHTYGQLQIYSVTSVPTTVFALPDQKGECHA